jgi:hypothetical protein
MIEMSRSRWIVYLLLTALLLAASTGCSSTTAGTLHIHGTAIYTEVGSVLNPTPSCGNDPWRMDVRDGSEHILKVLTTSRPRQFGTGVSIHCTATYDGSVPNADVYQFTFPGMRNIFGSADATFNRSDLRGGRFPDVVGLLLD